MFQGSQRLKKNVSNNHPKKEHKNLLEITKKITEKQKFQILGSWGEQVKHKFDLLIVGLQTTPRGSQSLDGKKLKSKSLFPLFLLTNPKKNSQPHNKMRAKSSSCTRHNQLFSKLPLHEAVTPNIQGVKPLSFCSSIK